MTFQISIDSMCCFCGDMQGEGNGAPGRPGLVVPPDRAGPVPGPVPGPGPGLVPAWRAVDPRAREEPVSRSLAPGGRDAQPQVRRQLHTRFSSVAANSSNI